MKILLFNPTDQGGIGQASNYLRDYLSKFHRVDMITNRFDVDPSELILSRYDNHDLILVHDMPVDITKIKSKLNTKIVYFVPGMYPHRDGIEKLADYDYIISPFTDNFSKDLPATLKWCFDIPKKSNHLRDFKQRKNDLLYIGRIDAMKMSIHFLANLIKAGHNITIAGSVRKNNEEEELIAKLLENNQVNFLGQVDHKDALDLMKEHKYSVLASQTDIFSLFMLESIYAGCIPLIKRRKFVDLAWVVPSTKRVWNAIDIIHLYENLMSLPDDLVERYRNFHYMEIIENMLRLSNIDIFNQVFDS